ncbi:MAG: transcription antitermination factor NusB [Bacillota bacterium]|nr:transcription antitermination factor NusB [Bacillota bacterium]
MNRRKSREVAMTLLYESTINKEKYEDIFQNFSENTDIDMKDLDIEFIKKTLFTIEENLELIDKKIEDNLINWKINRLSKIDLSILRLCTYEIMFDEEIPDIVSVNEAVELSKKYSDPKSSNFINGVLDKIIKK